MDSDIFYCVFCGSGCRVACFPTHCEKYTCHNPFCSAHGPVLQDAPQEKTTSASTGCRNGNLGQQSNDTSFVSQADDAATGLAHQPDDPSVSHGLAADISPHAYLFSKTATTSTMGQYNEIIPSGRSKSEEIQMIRSPDMEPSITEVEPGLFVGNIHCIKERFLREMGITAVVTFYTSPISDKHDSHMRQTIPLKTRLFLKAVNSKKQDLIQYFPGACEFIDRRLRPYLYRDADETDARESEQEKPALPGHTNDAKKKQKVLIHCRKGESRSVATVAAYLMYKKRKSDDEVIDLRRRCHYRVNPNPSFQAQLLQLWYEIRFKLYCNEMFKVRCKEYEDFLLRLKLEELRE